MATPININNASLDELKTITGISDKRAQKIIKKRKDLHLHLKT
jgi:DNA uptake protein ComE-like DNA-binding protein